jgi:hypothetical protein
MTAAPAVVRRSVVVTIFEREFSGVTRTMNGGLGWRWMVGILLCCGLLGCEKDEKFTLPENPAPWDPNLTPAGAGAGGGARRERPKAPAAETEAGQAAESTESSEETAGETGSAAKDEEGGEGASGEEKLDPREQRNAEHEE